MDPSGQKPGSEFNPDIPGNPESGAKPGDGRSCRLRKRAAWTVAVSVVLVILMVAVVALAVLVLKAQPQFMAWCPDGWIGYQGKCYYFSKAEENWNNSQRHCSALGASLALIDSEQDLALMMRYKGVSEHWIGLWREQEGQRWKWVNGSDLNSSLLIRGGGDCAYLNDKNVSSSRCITERNWVCSKPDAFTSQKNAIQSSQELKNLTTDY
ncbi:C-type lectin domain family 2 member B isoform X4 [Chelonia mydas]|uniref:C-type lectin domain family 2 member B isoform X4 n=1 Tax=Chelonia mydas TaxID=8469 RepID=UPI0018A1D950|nr:C-type lectin domain family 2 member B isoform X4 [Chelonia mydas]XP_043384206.1 C-type lectin domain family 2 member B isoform X4 [Chelonia mydas]